MEFVLDTFGMTDVGLRRDHNEDHFYVNDDLGLYIVADGMGGHAAGEVASHTAIRSISDFLFSAKHERDFTWPFGIDTKLNGQENLIISSIKLANREICALSEEKAEYSGMGTTIVGAMIDGTNIVIAHVGDSRLYRLRGEQFDQLTNDHSWVNEQLARSIITEEEARTHRWRNVITRALGNTYTIDVDMAQSDLMIGDIYLLCTDGLSGMLADAEINRLLRASSYSAETAARRLVAAANDAGGHDNITVLMLRVLDPDEVKDGYPPQTEETSIDLDA